MNKAQVTMNRLARGAILLLAALFTFGAFGVAYAAGPRASDDYATQREDEGAELLAVADDDDDGPGDDDTSSFTSGVNSNDGTGSGHTPVSRDRDRSRGDKTRDRTRDGKGGPKRDWSGGHTNDRSRRDSR
jgi:hypothetical protein